MIISCFIVKDYGITSDTHDSLILGHKYLNFYTTGKTNLKDNSPVIKNHFSNASSFLAEGNHFQIWWTLPNILSAATCYLFFQKLKICDPMSAHHIAIPIMVVIFLLLLFILVRKLFGNVISIITILSIITYPRFFGHSFNNIKDIPALFLFSLTILFFALWIQSNKLKYLYLSFIICGLSFATKMDTVVAVFVLFLWQLPFLFKKIRTNNMIPIRTVFHFLLGFFIIIVLFFITFPPLLPWFYKTQKEFAYDATMFLVKLIGDISTIGFYKPATYFNFYAPSQIFYTTPIIIFVFFVIGFITLIVYTIKQKESRQLNVLLLIWLLLPVFRHCLPHMRHYDGLRHFFVFITPFAITVAMGLQHTIKLIAHKTSLHKNIIALICVCLVFVPNIYTLIKTHPYQTTYYNEIVGGLKGAQTKEITFSYDYWLSSVKEALAWIVEKEKTDITVACYPHSRSFDFYKDQYDIKINVVHAQQNLPQNTYFIHIPRKERRHPDHKAHPVTLYVPDLKNYQLVHQIKRQGGIITHIYKR
jgi:hypothetical protein